MMESNPSVSGLQTRAATPWTPSYRHWQIVGEASTFLTLRGEAARFTLQGNLQWVT